jgi:hypothetical protein
VRADGSVYCWGWNAYGQCQVPEGLARARKVGAGYLHTVALDEYGMVTAWGGNDFGIVAQTATLGLAGDIDSGSFSAISLIAPCSDTPSGQDVCGCGPFQIDSNFDNIPDCAARRFGDLDLDGLIGAGDLSLLLDNWNDVSPPIGDLDRDGTVGASDLSLLLLRWGTSLG